MSFDETPLAPSRRARLIIGFARFANRLAHREVTVAGFRMHYLEGGHGDPLVLLHGIGGDKDNWIFVAGALRKRYRVIIPDLPGFGDSDKPIDADYSVAAQVARLRAFTSALGVDRFHIAGNSMGGMIAAAYCAAHTEQIASAWLLAPAGVKSATPSPLMAALDANDPELPIFARDVPSMRKLMAFVTHKPRPMPGFMIRHAAANQQATYALNQKIIAQLNAGPGLEEILAAHPRTPALIVWGDRDRAVDCSGAPILAGMMPSAKAIVMPDVGHLPMIEAPSAVLRDYFAFRATVGGAGSVRAAA